MASNIMVKILAIICCWIIPFAISETLTNSLKTLEKTERVGRSHNSDKWNAQKVDPKGLSSNGVTYNSDLNDSQDSVRHEILSELDDFLPDRSVVDKYTYSPGGFYVPHERKAKLNYHFEEVIDNDKNENKRLNSNESYKDLTSKVLTGSNQIEAETEVIQRPTFISVLKKAFLNPLVIISVAAIPLAFIIEMMFPYVMSLFSENMMPSVATTIAGGFARNLDGNTALHVEQILDVINEFGVKALEDPKCLQRFLCQGAKSQLENHSDGSRQVQKIVQILEKSLDVEILDKYGLKKLFNSVQNRSCESLVCKGSSAYTQDVPLYEKLYLLGAKVFNLTEIVH